jgi:hypothetical protein
MRRRAPANGNGGGYGGANGGPGVSNGGPVGRAPVAVGPGLPAAVTAGAVPAGSVPAGVVPATAVPEPIGPGSAVGPRDTGGAGMPTVSPLRTVASPTFMPAEPIPTYAEPPGAAAPGSDDEDQPALPDEARARAADAAAAPTVPIAAAAGSVLHVRFSAAAAERIVGAMEAFREVLRDRPGATRVVIHVPGPGGGEMELRRGIAYDPELTAEVRRRLGDGVAELHLS